MTPHTQLIYRFDVYGTPAPQGSKRFVGTTKAGRGIMIESSGKVKPWREAVKQAALVTRDQAPLDYALTVRMVFTVPKPATAPKRRKTWPDKKPDLSKLVRSTEDAMVDAGMLKDDSRIVSLIAWKVFPNEGVGALDTPGARITVYRMIE